MDGLPAYGEMKDLTITGYGQSELDNYAAEEAEKQGRYVIPDPDSGKGYFFRSDHFNFAKVGIPALYASGSYEHKTRGVDFIAEKTQKYLAVQYHQPQDNYNPEEWDLKGIALDAHLLFRVGYRLANETYFPQWNEGSEFKAKRDEEMGLHKSSLKKSSLETSGELFFKSLVLFYFECHTHILFGKFVFKRIEFP